MKQTLRSGERLVDLPGQLAQAGLEDGPFRLGVRSQDIEPPSQVLLCLHQARLEVRHGLGTLAFDLILAPNATRWCDELAEEEEKKDGTKHRPYLEAAIKGARARKRGTK